MRITCRLDFHTEIEWNENRKMLKVGGGREGGVCTFHGHAFLARAVQPQEGGRW